MPILVVMTEYVNNGTLKCTTIPLIYGLYGVGLEIIKDGVTSWYPAEDNIYINAEQVPTFELLEAQVSDFRMGNGRKHLLMTPWS